MSPPAARPSSFQDPPLSVPSSRRGWLYRESLKKTSMFIESRNGNAGNLLYGKGPLLEGMSRHAPSAVLVRHGGECLDGGRLSLEGRLILTDDVLAIGCPWQRPGVCRRDELPRSAFPRGLPDTLSRPPGNAPPPQSSSRRTFPGPRAKARPGLRIRRPLPCLYPQGPFDTEARRGQPTGAEEGFFLPFIPFPAASGPCRRRSPR